MPGPEKAAGCAADSWGASIVGTAPRENAYLILELAKPWPSKVKAEGAIAAFKPLLKGSKEEVKLLATPRIDWLPLCQRPWALLVRWHGGRALVQELPAQPAEVKAALEAPPSGEPLPLYLVCTHGSRDRCCGTLGFPIYRSLLEKSPRKVLQVSHLGGHRYAPVVLAFPEWRFFGHLDGETCQDLDRALNAGEPYLQGYRGQGRLREELQPVEAALWAEHGSQLLGVSLLEGKGERRLTVRADLAGGQHKTYQAKLGVQELRGFKSCSDIEDGKRKTIELPTLERLSEVSYSPRP